MNAGFFMFDLRLILRGLSGGANHLFFSKAPAPDGRLEIIGGLKIFQPLRRVCGSAAL
jgi:hypothetical protein